MSRIRANQITNKGANGAPNFPNGLTATGIITATISNSTLGTLAVTGNATIDGNLGVGGTITYEDVARVDATGISTFREGFKVGPLSGIGLTAYKDGSIRTSGIVTAASFVGDGSGLTGAGPSLTGSTNNTVCTVTGANAIAGEANLTFDGTYLNVLGEVQIGNASNHTKELRFADTTRNDAASIKVENSTADFLITNDRGPGSIRLATNSSERIRVGPTGQLGIAGANYGSAGQVIQSTGSGSSVAWANAPLVAYKAKHYRRARYSYSSSSWGEIDNAFRISHTPAATGNTIIAMVQIYGSISDGTYGGWTIVTDQGSGSDESMIGEMGSSGTIGKGSILGGNYFQEMYRSTNGGNMWMGQHLVGYHITENTNSHVFKLYGRMGNGTRYIGDNQPAQFMQIWEYRGDVMN